LLRPRSRSSHKRKKEKREVPFKEKKKNEIKGGGNPSAWMTAE
jgi:hypothetical protein